MNDEREMAAGDRIASETEADERLDTGFQFVIGRVTERDVTVNGEMVVPANTEVTAAEAAAALAAGALQELALAVGMADHSKMEIHGMPDDVEGSWDSLETNIMTDPEDTIPATGSVVAPNPPETPGA